MPNWCTNNIEINGPKEEMDRLATLLATGEQDFDFEVIAKTPEGDGWYEWRIENWGTKWNPDDSTVDRTSDTTMTAWFDTAWSPAIPLIQKLSDLFPTLEIKIEFEEEGLDFSGYKTFKGGEVISEEEFEYSDEDEENDDDDDDEDEDEEDTDDEDEEIEEGFVFAERHIVNGEIIVDFKFEPGEEFEESEAEDEDDYVIINKISKKNELSIRESKEYTEMTTARMFELTYNEADSVEEQLASWQKLVDSSIARQLSGFYENNANELIRKGIIEPPLTNPK